MRAEDVPALANAAGARFRAGLELLDGVVEVRGWGLLLGIELDPGRLGPEPARGRGGCAVGPGCGRQRSDARPRCASHRVCSSVIPRSTHGVAAIGEVLAAATRAAPDDQGDRP